VNFDISWDEVACTGRKPEAIARVIDAQQISIAASSAPIRWRQPIRRLFRGVDIWAPVWKQLTPDAS
jgi:hypothetical protein